MSTNGVSPELEVALNDLRVMRVSSTTPFAEQESRLCNMRERMLSRVRRWGIVPTIQSQSVAEHSFYVALMASRLAALIRWKATNQDLFNLNRWALLHDSLEAVTGDLPTPIKRHLRELKSAEHTLMSETSTEYNRLRRCVEADGGQSIWSDISRIVSFADSIEALSFLHTEHMLGNSAVGQVAGEIRRRVEREYSELPFNPDMSSEECIRVWEHDILPVIDGRVRNWPVVA